MKIRTLDVWSTTLAVGVHMVLAVACTREPVMSEGSSTTDMSPTDTTAMTIESTTGPLTPDPDSSTGPTPVDLSGSTDTGVVPTCLVDGTCGQVDIVFVIDNSGSMGDEQLNLARSFQTLIDELDDLQDQSGIELNPSVNIMVTTTDMGHPLCTAFQKPDYDPRMGAPVYQGCNARINRFTGLSVMPLVIEEACTENCPVDIAPSSHFITFDVDGTNVPGDDVGAALACIGPQGIDGCGYESPLEAMLQAINEGACWNNPGQASCDDQPEWADVTEGFLRDDAMLAVVLATDELDCSVQPPRGYSFFTDNMNTVYWNDNPGLGIPQASSAICFNAGVTCTDDQGDGLYEGCDPQDSEVLQPLDRYTSYFDYLASQGKEIVMLNLVGVPQVVAHNPDLPHEPTAGGLADLLYRNWIDFPYPAGDILPAQWDQGVTAANKIFEFGALGPGCFGQDDQGEIVSQALPPVRNRDVCQSLDYIDEDTGEPVVRCCIESVCENDFSSAFRCLTGTISQALTRTHT